MTDQAKTFLESYENSFANLTEACKKVGITRTYVMQLVQKDPQFARQLWEIQEGFLDLAISTQFKLGLTGDGKCLSDFLNANATHRGYGKTPDPDKSAYSDIIKPQKGKNLEVEFKNQLKDTTTEAIEEALQNIKNVKI